MHPELPQIEPELTDADRVLAARIRGALQRHVCRLNALDAARSRACNAPARSSPYQAEHASRQRGVYVEGA